MSRLLTCPQCAARYRVPDSAIGPDGKTVRCHACKESWHVEGTRSTPDALELQDLEEAAVDTPVEVEAPVPVGAVSMMDDPDPVPAAPKQPRSPRPNPAMAIRAAKYGRRRRRRLTLIAFIWGAVVAILALGLVLALLGRQSIVERFPQTASLYVSLGFDVTPSGVRLSEMRAERVRLDGAEYLLVEGEAVNLTDEPRWSPSVELALLDNSDTELLAWSAEVGTTRLDPRERRTFRSEVPNPPLDAARLTVRLDGAPE